MFELLRLMAEMLTERFSDSKPDSADIPDQPQRPIYIAPQNEYAED